VHKTPHNTEDVWASVSCMPLEVHLLFIRCHSRSAISQ